MATDKRIPSPELFTLTAEMLGETEWELFSDGEGDDVVEGTGFACLANFLRAAAKLACPADMDGSVGAGVDSLLCKVG